MKTRNKIILLLTIIVIVLLVINTIIPAYLHNQSDKLGFILYNCALGIDRMGPLILYVYNNGTHTIDENSCVWIKNTIKDSEKTEDLQQIQSILDYCHKQDLMKNGKLVTEDDKPLGLFPIGLEFSNDTHYIDNNICEWQPKSPIIKEDDFEETFGGLGNRHPAFYGYYIPEICSRDTVKHLVQYSSMFDKGVSYVIAEIGLPDGVDRDEFNQCVVILLENRDEEPSWRGMNDED